MKKFSISVAVMLLAVALSASATPIDPFNVRPITVLPGSETPLQTLFNSAGIPMNVNTDQNTAGMWSLGGLYPSTIPVVLFEIAGMSGSNQMGIWSDSNWDTDMAGRTLVDIFNGAASPATRAALTYNRNTGLLTITQVEGPAGAVNAGTFAGINIDAFGFYLQPGGGSDTFYSLDLLNGGSSQMVAYRETGPNRWTIAFEDIAYRSSDKDFNDFVFQIESITPVPEPATMLLLGAGLLGLAAYGRKRLV